MIRLIFSTAPPGGASRHNRPQSRSRRAGMQALEVVIVLPILILLLVAGIQFGMAMLVEQAVTHAATVAAREAGKGASTAEVVQTVECILAPHAITLGPYAGLLLEDPAKYSQPQKAGSLACDAPVSPALESGDVRVTLCVALDRRPFLNALRAYGIDLTGRRFVVRAAVQKES